MIELRHSVFIAFVVLHMFFCSFVFMFVGCLASSILCINIVNEDRTNRHNIWISESLLIEKTILRTPLLFFYDILLSIKLFKPHIESLILSYHVNSSALRNSYSLSCPWYLILYPTRSLIWLLSGPQSPNTILIKT